MPAKNKLRVIIDTNIWISFLIGKKLRSLRNEIVHKNVRLVVTEQLLVEIQMVAARPKILKYFPEQSVFDLIQLLTVIAEYYEVNEVVDICRDPKDNFLLSLSASSQADYLVTSDNDLLVLKKYKSTKIISVREFETLLKDF